MQKTAQKSSKYSKNDSCLKMAKIGHYAKAIAFAKTVSLGRKLKFTKTCEKRLYNHARVVLCKKRLQEVANQSKNDSCLKMAKIGHYAKAIAFAKTVSLGRKLKFTKTCEKRLYNHARVVLCKKRLQQVANIRKITPV